mgnify:CR=1 FL=1
MDFQELICTKRTFRRFLQKPVDDKIVEEMLNAARLAASAANLQPLRYAVVKSPEMAEKIFPLTRWAGYLAPEDGYPKEGERPVLYVLVLCDSRAGQKWHEVDAGLALGNMTLSAWAHGVGSCIIASVDREKAAALLNLPPELSIYMAAAFGYPAHRSSCTDMERDGGVKYTLDENRDYVVPKRKLSDMVLWY